MKISIFLVLILSSIGYTFADNCTSLIQHGLYNEVRKSSAVDSYQEVVNNVCKDYSKFISDKKSGNVKATYGAFGGKAGFNSETYESISDSMCSKFGSIEQLAKNDRVLEKIISADAIDAYKTCQKLNSKGLKVTTKISDDGDYISVSLHFLQVGFAGEKRAFIEIHEPNITNSEQFTCGGSLTPNSKLIESKTVEYHCSRNISGKESDIFSYKNIRMYAKASTLTIPTSVASIYREVPAIYAQQVPSRLENAVVAFKSDACPDGWDEYKPAYGRFIRGIDKSGLLDPGRTIGSEQDDSFESHVHSTFAGDVTLGRNDGGTGRPQQSGTQETGSKGGSETRPKNVALLYCEKK